MSSSSTPRPCYYDVFLSFRGVDTRKTIVSHLHKELVSKGILTFKDDRTMELGDCIPRKLCEAIKTSRLAVVVISKNYATSSWCLEELRLIMELVKKKEIGVIPIFYRVDPSDVRNYRGSFALTRFRSPVKAQKSLKWKEALVNIADRKGSHSRNCVDEATMVEDIVQSISSRLLSILPIDFGDIVGMEGHMEGLRPLLDMDMDSVSQDEVRMIGIWGMAGIGKTTIAKYLYERHKLTFPRHHYLMESVSKLCEEHGLLYLQQKLLSEIFREKKTNLESVEHGRQQLELRLKQVKVFLVLDGVDDVRQLNALAKEVKWFGPGSRIIITTRDKSLLNSCGVKTVYDVKYMDDDKALQLFQRIAFEGGTPPSPVYTDLSSHASRLAQGLPLALEALGSTLRKKSIIEWQDALKSFEEAPYKNMMIILNISYNSLDGFSKSAFLHVACLFNGEPVRRVMNLLDQGEVGIKDLKEKSLIHISVDGYIAMHGLVEQTGRRIVRQESNNSPAKQRILWHNADIYPLLENKAGTNKNEGVALNLSEMPYGFHIKWNVFKPMYNLKFLKICKQHSGGLDSCSRKGLILKADLLVPRDLRLLHWDAYPFTTLPLSIRPYCIVELHLRYSKLTALWTGTPPKFWLLRKLDLTGSKDLKLLPDLREAVCLEELILEGCISLKWIPKSICSLSRLEKLDVSNCNGLENLRITITESEYTLFQGISLRYRPIHLKFFGANLFVKDSQGDSLRNISIKGRINIALKVLGGYADHLSFNSEQHIPHGTMMLRQQTARPMPPPYGFKSLDIIRFSCNEESGPFKCCSFLGFPWLMELNLINLNIKTIPEDIHNMLVLEKLDLSGNDFRVLPATMILLNKLKHLTLCNCRILEELPELYQLERLTLSDCKNLLTLVNLDRGFKYSLLELWLDNCKNVESLSYELSHFTKLTYLDISRQDLKTVPASINDLTSLVTLCLNYCNKLISLTELPLSLKHLYAHGCKSLETFSLHSSHSVDHLDLSPCSYWEHGSSSIIRLPAGRRSKEVPLCACATFQETVIPSTNNQMAWSPKSILLPRLKPWLWALGITILIVGLVAIPRVTGIDQLSFHIYVNTLLMVILMGRRL